MKKNKFDKKDQVLPTVMLLNNRWISAGHFAFYPKVPWPKQLYFYQT
jgi:hypothetical protein